MFIACEQFGFKVTKIFTLTSEKYTCSHTCTNNAHTFTVLKFGMDGAL